MLPLLRPMAIALALATLAGLSPGPAQAVDDATRMLIDRGAWKELRTRVAPRLQAQPNDAEALWLMSLVKSAFGDPAAALDLAERAVKLDGRNGAYRLQLAEVCGQMAQKAGPLKGMGLGKRFKKEAEEALVLDPKLMDARVDLMTFYLVAPGIAGGSQKKAEAMAAEIMNLDPVEGHLARARLALDAHDTTRAGESYRKAAEVGATRYEARMAAANFFASRRQWKTAEAEARAALSIDPGRAGAYSLIAIVQVAQDRWSEIEATLAAAAAAVPDNHGPYYQAARMLVVERKDPERAERYLRKYLSIEPEGASPTWAHAQWRLSHALEQRGRTPEAIAALQTALQLKPDLDDAKKDLKRLKRGRPVATAR